MNEPWWSDYLRGVKVITSLTASSYLFIALLLFWPGWKLTGRVDRDWIRVFLRAGLIAIAFAPAAFMGPGGEKFIVPALLSAIVNAIVYPASGLALGFYFYHALISILVFLFVGVVVCGVYVKVRRIQLYYQREKSSACTGKTENGRQNNDM